MLVLHVIFVLSSFGVRIMLDVAFEYFRKAEKISRKSV